MITQFFPSVSRQNTVGTDEAVRHTSTATTKLLKRENKRKKKKSQQKSEKIYAQSTLNDSVTIHDESYGDKMLPKSENSFRIGFQNVNNIPAKANHHKSKAMLKYIQEGEYDIFLLAEVGLRWKNLPSHDSWPERTLFDFPDNKAIFGYNTTEKGKPNDLYQHGGVGVIATDHAQPRIVKSGVDGSYLGRWAWMMINGKENHRTVVVSAYRPCINKEDVGSVFMQHVRGLGDNDNRNPLDAFEEDLSAQISQWQVEGYHIVIAMDANENALDGSISRMMYNLGLRDVFLVTHGLSAQPPSTCARSHQPFPIDSIWVSSAIQIAKAGFHAFDEAIPSDHRCLWFEVEHSHIFGHKAPKVIKPIGRRLKSNDPRLVSRYNNQVLRQLKAEGLMDKVRYLNEIPVEAWTKQHEQEYNRIHERSTMIRMKVEQKNQEIEDRYGSLVT